MGQIWHSHAAFQGGPSRPSLVKQDPTVTAIVQLAQERAPEFCELVKISPEKHPLVHCPPDPPECRSLS